MIRGVFITGTDTGIGKTVVTAGVLRWLRQRGMDAVPMKPVQTGAGRRAGRLVSPDLEFCLSVAGVTPAAGDAKLMSPYLYEPACSPHLAGRLSGRYAEIPEIVRCAETLSMRHGAVLVEGAGGVMVPINEHATMLDLIQALGCPVVLVARSGLGTINHTLLSALALERVGINLLGVVLNQTEPPRPEDRFIEQDNPQAISRFSDVRVLGRVNYSADLSPGNSRFWEDFETGVPWLKTVLEELTG